MAELKKQVCVSIANLDDLTREEWLEKRREGIGGSDAGAVVGMNNYKSPIAVWQEKTGRTAITDDEDNDYMRIGRDLEDYVASRFEEATGKKTMKYRYMLQSVEHPFMFADVDRLLVDEDAGLEIKTASSYKAKEWAEGKIPYAYEIQCNHYMAVTGLSKWYICALVYPHIEIRLVERDEELIETLTSLESDFWNNYVVADVIPPIDGSDACSEAVKELYPTETPDTIIELDQFADLMERYWEIEELLDKLDREQEEIKNRIKAEMKDNSTAIVGNYKITWKTSKPRATVDTDKLKRDGLFDQYKKLSKPSRVFRCNEMIKRGE